MPRFADEEYHRLAERHAELILSIARKEAELEEVEERLERLTEKYTIDYRYVRRLEEEGI